MKQEEIKNLIRDLVENMTISIKDIAIKTEEDKDGGETTWFSVEVEEPHVFIQHEGEGLASLNHLVRRIVESNLSKQETQTSNLPRFLIDINGFQRKKIENIHALVHMMAERARYFKSNIEIDPMGAFERRVVHEYLSNANDLTTESVGEGANRRVVIKYIGQF